MRSPAAVPSHLRGRPFRVAADLPGLPGRGVRDGPSYRRLEHGVYADAAVARTPGLRVESVRAALGDAPVLSGASAAWALGSPLVGADDDVEVVVERGRRLGRRGVVVRRDVLAPSDVVLTRWGRTTSVARTAYDLGRRGPLGLAVEQVDAVLHAGRVGVPAVRGIADAHPGARGLRLLRRVLELADPAAESPRESALRLLLVLSGLPAPVSQHDVVGGDGRFAGRLDLAWPAQLVGVEYDGAHHRDGRQHSRDLDRHNRLRAAGWVVLQVEAPALRRPADVVVTVAAVLSARGW